MENWQKYYVKKKWADLQKTTTFSPIILAKLEENNLISEEEGQKLAREYDRKGQYSFADKLYEILKTRTGAYEKLLEIFEDNDIKLTGAAQILRDGEEWHGLNPNIDFEEECKGIFFNVQNPVPGFVGRNDEVLELESALTRVEFTGQHYAVISQVQAVTGLGGIGKTELCRFYIKMYKKNYENVIWLDADNEHNLINAFYELADNANIGTGSTLTSSSNERKDTGVLLTEVYAELSKQKTLIIFDNADNNELVANYLPTKYVKLDTTKISVILTSRYQDWSDKRFKVIELEGLKTHEAVEFVQDALFKSGPEKEATVDEVHALVGKLSNRQGKCFPLALRQAVAYIKYKLAYDASYAVWKYNKEFEEELNKPKMLAIRPDPETDTYKKTTRTTWNISIAAIREEKEFGEIAFKIFQMMSLISPDRIKREIFLNISDDPLKGTDNDKRRGRILGAVNLLVSYSMISPVAKNQTILSVHRLVQEVTRLELHESNGNDENQIISETLDLLNFDFVSQNLQHVASVWNYAARHASIVREYYFNKTYTSRLTPLHLLCNLNFGNSTKSVETLLHALRWWHKSKVVNAKDGLGRTPLWWAASSGNADAMEILIKNRAKPSKSGTKTAHYHWQVEALYEPTATGSTELHIAAMKGRYKCVELLSTNFPYLRTATNSARQTPASLAAGNGFLNITELLEPHTNPQYLKLMYSFSKNDYNSSEFKEIFSKLSNDEKKKVMSLEAAIEQKYKASFIEFLIENGAQVEQVGDYSPLHVASKIGDVEVVKCLIKHGANPANPERTGYTPLHFACQRGNLDVVKYILSLDGVDVDVKDDKGDTPLHAAAFHGKLEVVKVLLDAKAEVNCGDRLGATPIISAAIGAFFDIVQLIMDERDDVIINMKHVPGNEGTVCHEVGLTLLHAAAAYGKLDIVKNLMETKDNTGALDESCVSPLHMAVLFNQVNVIEYLIEKCKPSLFVELNLERFLNGVSIILEDCTFPFAVSYPIKFVMFILKSITPMLRRVLSLTPGAGAQLEHLCTDETRKAFLEMKCTASEIGDPGFILRKLFSIELVKGRLKFLQDLLKGKMDEDVDVLYDFDAMTFFSSFVDVEKTE